MDSHMMKAATRCCTGPASPQCGLGSWMAVESREGRPEDEGVQPPHVAEVV
jgi:hypothetical protein